MSRAQIDACGYFRPTLKPNFCKCGEHRREHSPEALASVTCWRWGWRARHLAQPDEAECE